MPFIACCTWYKFFVHFYFFCVGGRKRGKILDAICYFKKGKDRKIISLLNKNSATKVIKIGLVNV